ncbi:MAG: hypothetical protein A4E65_02888 [Syntrophorhabdus sp. PtaU1.Bin153]|nr:MAG: hypothetical protein A4E65_02888 [Syntrophorhabdus sp. PtaU1.Bin153]
MAATKHPKFDEKLKTTRPGGRSWLRSLFGPPDIDRLIAMNDKKGLLKAIQYRKDPAIRRAAIDALPDSWLGVGGMADDALREVLDRDSDVEVVAVALRKAAKSSLVYHWEKYLALLLHAEIAIQSAAVEFLISCLKKVVGGHKSWVDEHAPRFHSREQCLSQDNAKSSLHYYVDEYVSLHDAMTAALNRMGGRGITPNVSLLNRYIESNDLATYVVRTYQGELLREFFPDLTKLKWRPTKDAVGAAYLIWAEQWDMVVDMGAVAITPLCEEFWRGCYECARREWGWTFYRFRTGMDIDLDHVGSSGAPAPLVLALERIGEQAVVAMIRKVETGSFFKSLDWSWASRNVEAYLLLVFNADQVPISAETQATLDDTCKRIRKHLRIALDKKRREHNLLNDAPW